MYEYFSDNNATLTADLVKLSLHSMNSPWEGPAAEKPGKLVILGVIFVAFATNSLPVLLWASLKWKWA